MKKEDIQKEMKVLQSEIESIDDIYKQTSNTLDESLYYFKNQDRDEEDLRQGNHVRVQAEDELNQLIKKEKDHRIDRLRYLEKQMKEEEDK